MACEFSGRVRDAFTARGHDATSCDLLPSWTEGKHHQGNVLDLLDDEWDLMVAHPPCTYLANSGVCWLYKYPSRWGQMKEGAQFFRALLNAPILKKAIENPVMHKYAVEIVGRRQDQTFQPWDFGHPESKRTCLWLEGLSPLEPTTDLKNCAMTLPREQRERTHFMNSWSAGDPWRRLLRSVTYQGVADAMAAQWGSAS